LYGSFVRGETGHNTKTRRGHEDPGTKLLFDNKTKKKKKKKGRVH